MEDQLFSCQNLDLNKDFALCIDDNNNNNNNNNNMTFVVHIVYLCPS